MTETPQFSGVDLARVAPRAAKEAAQKKGGGRTAQPKPRTTSVVRRGGREPRGLGAAISALVTERAWDLPAAGATLRERWAALAPDPASAGRTSFATSGPTSKAEHPATAGRTGRDHHRVPRPPEHPASAGRTPAPSALSIRSAEHPRVGGDDPIPEDSVLLPFGTPPRRRGGLGAAPRYGRDERNTPASAGRTPGLSGSVAGVPEHPRVGGEDWGRAVRMCPPSGTPPRRRGGLGGHVDREELRRNTPASAGRTWAAATAGSGCAEHPRVGGEDPATLSHAAIETGTPPRRRGGPALNAFGPACRRNTPASAGRTRRRRARRGSGPEHPRVGGEDPAAADEVDGAVGTPPRRRGGRRDPHDRVDCERNTPASAGRTRPSSSPLSGRAEHPRVGGEDSWKDVACV